MIWCHALGASGILDRLLIQAYRWRHIILLLRLCLFPHRRSFKFSFTFLLYSPGLAPTWPGTVPCRQNSVSVNRLLVCIISFFPVVKLLCQSHVSFFPSRFFVFFSCIFFSIWILDSFLTFEISSRCRYYFQMTQISQVFELVNDDLWACLCVGVCWLLSSFVFLCLCL